MSVSLDHEVMVSHLIKWLDEGNGPFCPRVLSSECGLHPNLNSFPPTINGHRPDVFAVSNSHSSSCLIGEAKTSNDLETYRTEVQLRAFTRHLKNTETGYLALGVAWPSVPSARSLLRKILLSENARDVIPLVIDCSAALLESSQR